MKRIICSIPTALTAALCALAILILTPGCRTVAPKPSEVKPITIVVAADGNGQFTNVQAAIMSVPSGSRTNPVVIHIKPGTYQELVYVQREKRFFKLVGEDPATTVITYDLYANLTNFDGKPLGTFRTPYGAH